MNYETCPKQERMLRKRRKLVADAFMRLYREQRRKPTLRKMSWQEMI